MDGAENNITTIIKKADDENQTAKNKCKTNLGQNIFKYLVNY